MKVRSNRVFAFLISTAAVAIISYRLGRSHASAESEASRAAKSEALEPRFEISERSVRDWNGETAYHWARTLANLRSDAAPEVLEQLQAQPNSPRKSAMLREFFKRWGELGGAEAFEAAKVLPGRDRLSLLSEAAAGWARVDPAAAWRALMRASNNGTLFGGSSGLSAAPLLREVAINDLDLAMAMMDGVGRDSVAKEQFEAILEVASEKGEYDRVLENLMRRSVGGTQSGNIYSLFEMWGRYEVDAPLLALSGLANSELAEKSMSGFMDGWARADAREAFAYALENVDNPLIGKTFSGVARSLAASSTALELVTLFEEIEDPAKREKIAPWVVPEMAKADPAAAFAWAGRIQDGQARASSQSRVISSWAGYDFDGAKAAYLSERTDQATRASAAISLTMQAIAKERPPEETIALISAASDSNSRRRSMTIMGQNLQLQRNSFRDPSLVARYQAAVTTSALLSEEEKAAFYRELNLVAAGGELGTRK